jgi:hypothetical protein
MAQPPAPLIAPVSGTTEQRLQQLADAISRKQDRASEPVYASVLLLAPNGAAWRLSVDNTGALSTAAVPR